MAVAVVASAREAGSSHELLRYAGTRRRPGYRKSSPGLRSPNTSPRSRDGIRPSFANSFAPQKKRAQRDPQERARGRPGARCTRGLMCNVHQKKCAHEHTGSAETLRPSLRNGFTTYIVLSLVNRSLLPPSPPRGVSLSKDLTPAIRASGPHDFAVRAGTTRQPCRQRPPHPAPRFVTIASRPSWWDETRIIFR